MARTKRRAKASKKKPTTTKKKATTKTHARAAAPPFVSVDMRIEPRHLELLGDLARRFGCVTPRGEPALVDVLRAILDRYGDTMLRLAQPRTAKAHDEEE